ncbi:hypothetical protein [Paenibacillus sp. L3-i20]|uniref:hypothetical protein n=1 Tax=Paenibacillus sp. L3-i20 TaxID=2905833 RepID=UPI001EDFC0CA|nr:hypothetical protein [Paenibacillus sp. L3-i20]GKU79390.1 hypothetical protein L3i20_v237870 [Paenibacillus sp. L3-i20]
MKALMVGEDTEFSYQLFLAGATFYVPMDIITLHVTHPPKSIAVDKKQNSFHNKLKMHKKHNHFETVIITDYYRMFDEGLLMLLLHELLRILNNLYIIHTEGHSNKLLLTNCDKREDLVRLFTGLNVSYSDFYVGKHSMFHLQ